MAQGIDFSMLDRISAQAAETAEEQETAEPAPEQISFLQAGCTSVESLEDAYTAPPPSAPAEPQPETPQPQEADPERKKETFTDHTGDRDYNSYYRAAHDFHKKHFPPVVDREYWRTHTPGEDQPPESETNYWIEAAQDVSAASASGLDDPFYIDLLAAVYDEMEREYKALREEASRSA